MSDDIIKKDIRDIIEKETPNLNNLLSTEEVSDFKAMTEELRDTWTKKQMFRTETEARFSVLQDNRYPTKGAKYWQCVREQSSYLDNLMALSFDYRRNDAKVKYLEKKISTETDEYKLTKYEIDLDEARFGKASMEKTAKHRMREIKMWSKLKSEFKKTIFTKMAGLSSAKVLNSFKKVVDPRRYNGASLLGLKGIIIKSHGGADSFAFNNSLQIALKEIKKDVPKCIDAKLREILD